MQLGQIAQCVLEECISLENTRKHCYDNVTLLIVSLSDYLREFESLQKESLLPQQLALRKMDSESCLASREEDLADVSHSYESASLLSSAERSLLSGSVNEFFGISQPSSQNSSP